MGCIRHYVADKLTLQVKHILCPIPGCGIEIPNSDLRFIAGMVMGILVEREEQKRTLQSSQDICWERFASLQVLIICVLVPPFPDVFITQRKSSLPVKMPLKRPMGTMISNLQNMSMTVGSRHVLHAELGWRKPKVAITYVCIYL